MACCRRKLRAEFTGEDWNKQCPVKCSHCKNDSQRSASRGHDRRKHKRARRDSQGGCDEGCHQSMVQDGEGADSGEPTERRRSSRKRNSLRKNLGDRQDSGSEADLQDDERDVHQVQTCVLMSPAHPGYVGRGDDSSGGEVTYTMQEMRTLLQGQSGEAQYWLTTSQMGWSLFTEQAIFFLRKKSREMPVEKDTLR